MYVYILFYTVDMFKQIPSLLHGIAGCGWLDVWGCVGVGSGKN